MKVEIYVRINELNKDGCRKSYDIYNDFVLNLKTEIEDYDLVVRDICDAIISGEVRKNFKEIGDESLEE